MLAPLLLAFPAPVTYCRDIAPLIQKRCQVCHHPGTAAPFPLVNYTDAVKWAENMKEAINDRRMPPWFADPKVGKWGNDRHLSDGEIKTFANWVDQGMREGDPADLPKPIEYPDGWSIGTPDLIVELPQPEPVPAAGTLGYRWRSSKPLHDGELYITAAEVMPGNRRVVHHIEVFGFGSQIVSYAPGTAALIAPPDTAYYVSDGDSINWLLHYTPNGKETTDQSRLGMRLWKGEKPPKYIHRVKSYVADQKIVIAPKQKGYKVEQKLAVYDDTMELIAIRPHMHLRGSRFLAELAYPDGRKQTILHVPRYDFNWQLDYNFASPLRPPKGSTLHFTSWYDNSADNPNVPDPSKWVFGGLQTDNEMQTVLLDWRYEGPVRSEDKKPRPVASVLPIQVQVQQPDVSWNLQHVWWVSPMVILPLTGLVVFLRRKGRGRAVGRH
jgi:hypothetical protein